jgi:hypothetical protein
MFERCTGSSFDTSSDGELECRMAHRRRNISSTAVHSWPWRAQDENEEKNDCHHAVDQHENRRSDQGRSPGPRFPLPPRAGYYPSLGWDLGTRLLARAKCTFGGKTLDSDSESSIPAPLGELHRSSPGTGSRGSAYQWTIGNVQKDGIYITSLIIGRCDLWSLEGSILDQGARPTPHPPHGRFCRWSKTPCG